MRVLYVIDSLSPGGAETSLAALAPCYASRGVGLEVAYLHERPGLHAALEQAGAQLFSLAGPGGRLGWARRTWALVRARRPDLVHTTLFEADIAGRLAGAAARVPVVSSLVSAAYGQEMLDDPSLSRWRVRAGQAVDITTARVPRRFHAVSATVADRMARSLLIPRSRIDVVPRGRDPQALGTRTIERSREVRRRLGLSESDKVVVAAARHEHQKGLDILLQAIPEVRARHPLVRVLIAGREGNQTPKLRALTSALGLDDVVSFLGQRSDVADLLATADVFAFPSRWEGLPGTVLEAMALEAPIVASDIPTVREAITERHALLVPAEQPAELAASIIEAIQAPEEASARASAARERFLESFTIDRVADGMLAFYERALSG